MSGHKRIRRARVQDVPAICQLVNYYAEREAMLHRSLENAYQSLRSFLVAEDGDGRIIGSVAVDIFWADLAEVRSLAIDPNSRGKGVGTALLAAAVEDARELGVKRLFTLTYEQAFFAKHGFEPVDRQKLPEKVWQACIACPKADECDEVAMVLAL